MSELNGPKRSSGSEAVFPFGPYLFPFGPYLFPFGPYQGRFSLENLAFNANLQEFTQQAQTIADSHGQGHLDSDGALHQLEQLWQQLKASRHGLGISS